MKRVTFFSIWVVLMVVVSMLLIFEVAGAPAIGSFLDTYMQDVGQSSLIDFLTRPEVLGLILTVVTLLGGGAAWFMRRRRRVRARTLLDEVDEVYARFKMNSRRCEAELYRLKDVTLEKLKTGKIDESSYNIIKERIDEYMHEIRERIVDERLGGFPSKLRDELHDMIKRGEISEKEYKTLGRLIERTEELKDSDKAQLRELLEKWKRDYLKKETVERPIERRAELKEREKAKLTEQQRLVYELGVEKPIHTAALRGDVEQVKALLKKDPGVVNAQDAFGQTPLLRATMLGYLDARARARGIEVVRVLLTHGADVNLSTQGGSTPLDQASFNGYLEVVRVLLVHGADVNTRDDRGETPLHKAAKMDHAEVVELLLAEGAEVNVQTSEGLTALQLAEQSNHAKVAELLRKHKKRASTRPIERKPQEEPIITAASNGDVEQVKALLKKDPGLVNIRVGRGDYTPLHGAAQHGHAEVVELLLAKGARVNAKDTVLGMTPLHYAALFDHAEVVELLLAKGADVTAQTFKPNAQALSGYTALQLAERKGHAEVAELLREHEKRR